jgi:hypothetical protein
MVKIHLIGTVHADIDGERRLEKALREEEPEIVTVEMGKELFYYLDEAKKKGESLIRRMQIKGCDENHIKNVRRVMGAHGFEYRGCKSYCEKRGIPLHYIDDGETYPWISNFLDEEKPKKIPKRNILEKNRKFTNSWYRLFQAIFEGKLSGGGIGEIYSNALPYKILGERDRFMASRIQELASNCDGKIVHVGGLIHLIENNVTLYSGIREYNPSRKVLKAYDESFQRMGYASLMYWKAIDAIFKKVLK